MSVNTNMHNSHLCDVNKTTKVKILVVSVLVLSQVQDQRSQDQDQDFNITGREYILRHEVRTIGHSKYNRRRHTASSRLANDGSIDLFWRLLFVAAYRDVSPGSTNTRPKPNQRHNGVTRLGIWGSGRDVAARQLVSLPPPRSELARLMKTCRAR